MHQMVCGLLVTLHLTVQMCMTPWQERQPGLPSGALSHTVTWTLDWTVSLR